MKFATEFYFIVLILCSYITVQGTGKLGSVQLCTYMSNPDTSAYPKAEACYSVVVGGACMS